MRLRATPPRLEIDVRLIFLGNFVVIVGLNRRNNWRNIRSWERKVSLLHWRCSHSGLAQRYARTPAPIWLSLTAHPHRLIITRHRRRALSYLFRQFGSVSSSVQRLVVITVRDLVTTAAAGSMAATLTGADIIVIGTNQRLCRNGCLSHHTDECNGASPKDSSASLPFLSQEIRLASVVDSTREDRTPVICATRPSSVRLLSQERQQQPWSRLSAQHRRLRYR